MSDLASVIDEHLADLTRRIDRLTERAVRADQGGFPGHARELRGERQGLRTARLALEKAAGRDRVPA